MIQYTNSEFILRFNAEREAKAKQVQEWLASTRAASQPSTKVVENTEEYYKLFNADKARFLAECYNEDLAYSLACSCAAARENSARGWSND